MKREMPAWLKFFTLLGLSLVLLAWLAMTLPLGARLDVPSAWNDHFTTSPTAYDPHLWTAEEWAGGQRAWSSDTFLRQSACAQAHRTLASTVQMLYGTLEMRARSQDVQGGASFLGWSDAQPLYGYNYAFHQGANGVYIISRADDNAADANDRVMAFCTQAGLSSYGGSNILCTRFTVNSKRQFHTFTMRWMDGLAQLWVDGMLTVVHTEFVPAVPLPVKLAITEWAGGTGGWHELDWVRYWPPEIVAELGTATDGDWIIVSIELPQRYDATAIDVNSLRLNNTIRAASYPIEVRDYDGDGIPDLTVRFSRQALVESLRGMTGDISVIVSGQLADGTPFRGTGSARITYQGR